MNQPRDLDAIIATWLDDGPIDLPAETRRAIVVGLRTQPRARRMAILGGLPVNSLNRFATAAAIVLAVGALSIFVLSNRGTGPGTQSGPTPTATTTPSPSAPPTGSPSLAPLDTTSWTPFVSNRYGFSIAYPPDWSSSQAERTWVFETDRLTTPLTTADHFLGGPNGNQVGVSGWSADVPAGTSEDAWLTSYYANPDSTPANCGVTLDIFVPTTVDGHAGRMATSTCDDTQAFVFIGKRVYIFGIWRGETDPSVTAYGGSRRLLEAFLSTVAIGASITESPSPS